MTATTSIRIAVASALITAAAMLAGAVQVHDLHSQRTTTAMTVRPAGPVLCCDE
jgi:hypothetical protein